MEEEVHKCCFLIAVLHWRGSSTSVDYNNFTLFCRNYLYHSLQWTSSIVQRKKSVVNMQGNAWGFWFQLQKERTNYFSF